KTGHPGLSCIHAFETKGIPQIRDILQVGDRERPPLPEGEFHEIIVFLQESHEIEITLEASDPETLLHATLDVCARFRPQIGVGKYVQASHTGIDEPFTDGGKAEALA